jgi:hypothetical protein
LVADTLNCNASPAPGTKATSTDVEQPLTTEEHKAYRRAVGKLQWMTYTRPDISYATKELARSPTQPTTLDQQKLKHLLRYLKGTQHYRLYAIPIVRTIDSTPDLNIFVGSDWAGCATTRKSTSGFVIKLMGSTIHFGSRTQSTIALSSAEAELYYMHLYAINTGATESLHVRNLLQEALNLKKVNIRIHTDSSIEESQTHRAQTSLHPTTRAARSCEDYQDQHSKKHRGHLHQERGHQDALEASQRCWAHNTALLADTNSSKSFTAS